MQETKELLIDVSTLLRDIINRLDSLEVDQQATKTDKRSTPPAILQIPNNVYGAILSDFFAGRIEPESETFNLLTSALINKKNNYCLHR